MVLWPRSLSSLGSLLSLLLVAGFAVSVLILIQVVQQRTVNYMSRVDMVSLNMNNDTPEHLACSADFNQNGVVDSEDIDILKAGYGDPCSIKNSCRSDLNGDYAVDNYDLQIIITLLNKQCLHR